MILRLTKFLGSTGVFILLAGFLAIAAALFTPTGSLELLRQLAESTPGLELTYRKGTLSDRIVLDRLHWRAPNGTTVNATELDAGLEMKCWSRRVICLRESSVAHMIITVPASDKTSEAAPKLPEIRLPIPIQASSLTVDRLEIHSADGDPVILTDIKLSALWMHREINISALSLAYQQLSIAGDGTLQLIDQYPLDLSLQIRADTDKPFIANASITGGVTEIKLNAAATTPFDITTVGTIKPFEHKNPLQNFYLTWRNARWPLSDTPQVQSADGSARLSGNYRKVYVSTNAKIEHPNLPDTQVSLFGELERSGIAIESGIVSALGGTIDVNGAIDWRDQLDWNLQFQTTEISPATHWPLPVSGVNVEALFTGSVTDDGLLFGLNRLHGDLKYNDTQTAIDGDLHKDVNDNWHFDHLIARAVDSQIKLDGTLGINLFATAELSIQSSALLPGAQGRLTGELDLSGHWQAPNVSGALMAESFKLDQFAADQARIRLAIEELGQKHSTIRMSAQRVVFGEHNLSDARGVVDGSLHQHTITAQADSPALGQIALELAGQLDNWRNWTGTLHSAVSTTPNYSIELADSVALAYRHASVEFALAPHCWRFNDTSLCVDRPAKLGKQGDISFYSDNLSLSPLAAALPRQYSLEGSADARGRVVWDEPGQPVITLDSTLKRAEIIVDQGRAATPISVDVKNAMLDIDTRQGIINARLKFSSSKAGLVSAAVQMNTRAPDYPIWGSVSLSDARVRWLQSYFDGIANLRGSAHGQIDFGGTLADPGVVGEIDLNSIAFETEQLHTPVENLDAKIKFSGRDATFNGTAVAAHAPLAFAGRASLGRTGLQVETNVTARGIEFSNEYVERARLDADIRISVLDQLIETTGNVTLTSGTIQFGDDDSNTLQHSSDVIVLQEVAASGATPPDILKVGADVNVILGDDVRFRGWGLDTKLSGSLTAHLYSDEPPQIAGEISIDRGTYRSYGQDLTIRNGKIHFIGPPEQAALSAEAVRTQDTLTAGLRLEGSIQAPTATLFSEPALPDEEILSYLVLGRSLDERSDRQAQLLANAALYVGLRNGQLLSDKIANIFGIEDFYVTATGSGDNTQLMVSGRLTNRLLLRYGIGIFTPINTLYLRYDLAERLYVESTRGIERAVDLYYSFEF